MQFLIYSVILNTYGMIVHEVVFMTNPEGLPLSHVTYS